MKPEVFQQAANNLQSVNLAGPSQAEQLPQLRQQDASQSLPMSMGTEQADFRGLSETRLVELQRGLAGGRVNTDSWLPANLNSLLKNPPTIESASAILREACNGTFWANSMFKLVSVGPVRVRAHRVFCWNLRTFSLLRCFRTPLSTFSALLETLFGFGFVFYRRSARSRSACSLTSDRIGVVLPYALPSSTFPPHTRLAHSGGKRYVYGSMIRCLSV